MTPATGAAGRRAGADVGRAMSGPSMKTPTNVSERADSDPHDAAAGEPGDEADDAKRPSSAPPSKPAASTAATPACERSSRTAASGGIREARSDGKTAEPTVTSVPTTSATIAVRPANTVPPPGRSMPKRLHHAPADRRPRRPRPTRPTAEAIDADDHASRSWAQSTWRRVAPTDRSSAISLRALGDDDLERVVDREARDHETDRREHEEERAEEARVASCIVDLGLLGDLRAGERLDAIGQDGRDDAGRQRPPRRRPVRRRPSPRRSRPARRAAPAARSAGRRTTRWRRPVSRRSRTGPCRRARARAARSG